MGTGNGRKRRFPHRATWATAAVLSYIGIAWGAPVVPTSSGMQTLQQVYDYENSQLIKDYNQLFSTSKPSAQNQLSAQEIAWIQEKRAACGTVAKAQQSTQGLGCLIQHTDQRIVQIRQQEYGVGSSGSPALPTAPVTSPTVSTGSAVLLAPCPTPGTSASGGINWNSTQSIEQYLKSHEAATPPSASTACPPGTCCVKTAALPEQQTAQSQCAPATAPTASAKSACTIADQAAKDRVIISFIRQHESVGGVINRKASVPHYRNGNVIGHSGVTIGAGIDLGGMTVSQLTGYGMPSAFVELLKPYLGLQGQAALSYLDAHPLTIPQNLVSSLDQLQNDVEMKTINKVASLYTADASPHVNFFQLPAGAQTAIVDLAFQYGSNLAKAAPIFWGQVTHGQWSAAVTNLNNFGDSYPSRRESEGALIQADISSGKLPTNQSACVK